MAIFRANPTSKPSDRTAEHQAANPGESRQIRSTKTTSNVKHSTVLPLCAAAITALTTIATPALAQADNGCVAGYVPRNARPGDAVCVTPVVAARTAQENATAAYRREPNGGAYGPLTCKQGYVWREAFGGDGVCVTPDIREATWADNAAAASRRLPAPPVGTVPTPVPAPIPVPTPTPTPVSPA